MSSESCDLSPQARAFSTVLTAFVGSIVNGLTSGAIVAFMTGWISWLAVLRVLSGALISLYQGFSSDYARLEQDTGSQPADEIALEERGLQPGSSQGVARAIPQASGKPWLPTTNDRLVQGVTFLGWIGWLYTAVYSPIVQILWLKENWGPASAPLKFVRAFGISVSALTLTIDTKKRYASRLSGKGSLGAIAGVAFQIVHAASAFGMGVMCAALLIKGAIDAHMAWYIIVIYSVFCIIWAAASYRVCGIQDAGIKGFGLVGDVLMGAFAGIFLAAPAFTVLQTAEQPTLDSDGFSTPQSGQASLRSYLACDSVQVWQKFVAIFP